jgi:hypothetical protein
MELLQQELVVVVAEVVILEQVILVDQVELVVEELVELLLKVH